MNRNIFEYVRGEAVSIRTVRLDDAAESTLAALRQRTGLSISEVLKRGLHAYAEAVSETASEPPYEVFRRLDSACGGDAIAPASQAKSAVVKAIKKKHKR